jgi:DNA polymerase
MKFKNWETFRMPEITMTAEQQNSLTRFLDLASGFLGNGYAGSGKTACREDGGADSLERVAREVRSCAACELCKTRKNAVPGEGVPRPLVMVIGEGPGADEDATGRPFVGPAGQLLDRMLESKGRVGLSRTRNCFIANVVKCRPPGNRDPAPDETAACIPFLVRQINLLSPKIILCVGKVAANRLLGNIVPRTIGSLRGQFFEVYGIPMLPTYHPSALLRNEDLKQPAWDELQRLREKLREFDEGYRAATPGN